MEKRAAPLRVERDDPFEVRPLEVAVRPGAPQETEQRFFVPRLAHTGRHDLLREDVERPRRHRRAIEHRASNAAKEGRRLDQLV